MKKTSRGKRWLITGANGFVGQHFLNKLDPQKEKIFACVLPKSGALPKNVTRLEGDITEVAFIRKAVRLAKPDYVLHLAAWSSVPQCEENRGFAWLVNVGGSLALLETLWQEMPKARCLLVSSAQVYGAQSGKIQESKIPEPQNFYGVTKLHMEELGKFYAKLGLPVMIARSFNHIGPGQSDSFVAPALVSQIVRMEKGLQGRRLTVGNIHAQRDFLDVRDVVEAYRLLLLKGKPGGVYHVASGRGYSVKQLIEVLRKLSRVPFSLQIDKKKLRAKDSKALLGSGEKLRRDCGWTAKVPLEKSLRDLLNSLRAM